MPQRSAHSGRGISGFVLTRARAREVDAVAIERYGMCGLVLMENAGRGVVDVMMKLGVGGSVLICCGKGNNAGDGFVIARHLDLLGVSVQVLLCRDLQDYRGDAAVNLEILCKSGVPLHDLRDLQRGPDGSFDLPRAHWVVDALLGTGALGSPRSPYDGIIRAINDMDCVRLAIDLPSGLDADSGEPAETTVVADHTCTFVAPKHGLLADSARPFVGQLHTVSIGVPRRLLREFEPGSSQP